jgi:hypothetical protein
VRLLTHSGDVGKQSQNSRLHAGAAMAANVVSVFRKSRQVTDTSVLVTKKPEKARTSVWLGRMVIAEHGRGKC